MKMAIMGAGAIANKMAATIIKMEKVEAYAIAARDQDRAETFAAQMDLPGHMGFMKKCLRIRRWIWFILQHLILIIINV